ncbi:hypothetical protein BDB00DRAFT_21700 [Zychaea mexicana]|uniref:uncharacterized protein n=1 Tax=Zychaea mexicana TaxID=64656 RepID=UPI0022FE82E3|nr:uncharacterized protein BDB00DRAFT_21700 [Zychaea mexicana]KAI9497259.1 hypothetical protein BDB00DRAFT_21700 [Zychaea mexicana]
MVRAKKQSTPEVERLVSKFFKEDTANPCKAKQSSVAWRNANVPECIQIRPILEKLRNLKPIVEDSAENEGDFWKLSSMETEEIETIRKDNVFGEEVTEADMDIIQKRVALQQRQFKEFERRDKARKYKKIKAMFDYLTAEEIDEMLIDCENDEDEVIVRMTQIGYVLGIRKVIATKHAPEVETKQQFMTEEQQTAYQQLLKKRSETLKKTTNDTAKKQYRMGGRLALDDALKQVQENQIDPEKAFEGWSQARIRAYQMIDQNPNSYYYRFNAPGEIQRKGQWDEDERKVFFARLEEVGANGQWGIFAMKVPGRVGYQCSNFYRLLVETGEINDPNYVLDEKGKAHYLFDKKTANGQVEKTFRTHSKHGTGRASGVPSSSRSAGTRTKSTRASPSADRKTKRKKRKTRGWDSDDDASDDFEDYNDNSGTYTMSTRTRSGRRTRSRLMEEDNDTNQDEESGDADSNEDSNVDNPLPGFIDPITLDDVVKPAISKYGHVMGYDSWVRCLTNWEGKKNICPLTKKPMTKRDLVVLTLENIDEYRDQIINM